MPSAAISDAHIVESTGPDTELETLIRFDINSAVAGLVPDAPQMRVLLSKRPEPGGAMPVDALLEGIDASRALVDSV